MTSCLVAYMIGAVVMALVILVSGYLDKQEDMPEWSRILLLVLIALSWPYQLLVMVYGMVCGWRDR